MKQTLTTISVICMIIIIACNIGIYKYIEKMENENCECATEIKVVKFIKPSALIVPVIILIMLLSILSGTPLSKQKCMQKVICQMRYGTLSINMPNNENYTLEVLNPLGKNVLSKIGSGTKEYRFGASVAPGTYLFRIVTDKQALVKPLIIN